MLGVVNNVPGDRDVIDAGLPVVNPADTADTGRGQFAGAVDEVIEILSVPWFKSW